MAKNGVSNNPLSPVKISKTSEKNRQVQKDRQKSQLKSSDINFGAWTCIRSLIPNFVIAKIKKAAKRLTNNMDSNKLISNLH